MIQNLAILMLLAVMVYGSRQSWSQELGGVPDLLECRVQTPAVLLQEAMFGDTDPEIEIGDDVREFIIRDADKVMALIRDLAAGGPGEGGDTFHVSRSGDSIDFTRKVSMSVTLNYEYNLSTGGIVYTEITHDPWRDGGSAFFIAKGSCHATLPPE